MVTEPNVLIVSPNYAKEGTANYPSNSHCEITIRFTERVRLTFLEVSINDDAPCNEDYMQFFEGSTSTAAQIGSKWCGTKRPLPLYAKGSTMHLLFHSNHKSTGYGFKILAEPGKLMKNVLELQRILLL